MAISGFVDPRFASVEPLFAEIVASQPAGGSGFSAFVEGACVVDLVGGESRPGMAWSPDTLSLIFSCTKGFVSVLMGILVDHGMCDPESPVAAYWPEFARVSDALSVRQLLEHRAGLSAVRAELSLEDVLTGGPVLDALLEQEPLWEPGTGYAYHALTFGHLVGELIRRITGKTTGEFFAAELARPLGVDAWIGLPGSETSRVAEFSVPTPFTPSGAPEGTPEYWSERSLTFGNAFPLDTVGKPGVGFNDPAVHSAELPGANGITTARGIATIWSSVVTETNGQRTLTDDTLAMMTERRVSGPSVWGEAGPWWDRGFGLMLATPGKPALLSTDSFGHDGFGGQAGWADLQHKASIGFVTNNLVAGTHEHDRWIALVAEVRRKLES